MEKENKKYSQIKSASKDDYNARKYKVAVSLKRNFNATGLS
jgi:hypothetical protein